MSSQMPITASGLQSLPTELIQKIAEDLDDISLLAFASTSRNLRSKAYSVFGHRFFRTLKFFLHPVSLQALTDISNIPDLASCVQTVAFGTELVGIIDPIHDVDVKREALVHSECSTPPNTLEQLQTARCGIDAKVISQALRKLPKLSLIIIGKTLDLQGRPVRRSWGISTLSSFICLSGHCLSTGSREAIDVIFQTISFALQQARLRDNVKVCIGFGGQDRRYIEHNEPRLLIGNVSLEMIKRLNHVQLNLDVMEQSFITRCISPLFRHDMEILDVTFPGDTRFSDSLSLHRLPLNRLQRLTIKQLRTTASTLGAFLRDHTDRLIHVSLIECFVEPDLLSLRSEDTWLSVIMELQKMPQLTSLCLDHLELTWARERRHNQHGLDLDMTLRATWRGKEEVASDLHYLIATYRTFGHLQPLDISHDPSEGLPPLKNYLNLRYANFKASSRYAWTKKGGDKHPRVSVSLAFLFVQA